MEINIRNARPDDVDAMTALLNLLFAIETDFRFDAQRQHRGLSMMLDGCLKHRCIKVAEVEGQVVGMVSAQLLISTAEGGIVAVIEDLVVHDRFRGRGVGRLLMAQIEAWALEHGARRLQLLADRTNFQALDFYDKIGWIPTRMICLRRKWNPTK